MLYSAEVASSGLAGLGVFAVLFNPLPPLLPNAAMAWIRALALAA